jgi:allophanate hydrolase
MSNMSSTVSSLDCATLRTAYATGAFSPVDVVHACHARIARTRDNPIWISLVAEEAVLARARALADDPSARELPLYGTPFAVKDNIDVAGMRTTAACPSFAYTAERSATVVEQLEAAGAILVGKTNLDQLATGLVGTRSPYGAVGNAFDGAFVSGGSSSGSAVAVALGQVSFALGTDTAGSGRVPAAFNNIVGLKPSRGLISAAGVVPACRTIDCVSVFALTSADTRDVLNAIDRFDARDPFARTERFPSDADGPLRLGVPSSAHLEFFGDHDCAQRFASACDTAMRLGASLVEVDLAPFLEAAALLYEGPWVAERYAVVRALIESSPNALLPITRSIIGAATKFSAADAFRAQYRLAELRRATAPVWERIDALLLPTAGTIYTIEAVNAEPARLNANLGRYTNFVNLLDLSAIALPAGFRSDGLPCGVQLIAPALRDRWLTRLGDRWQRATGLKLGATDTPLPAITTASSERSAPGRTIELAVVGAHLSGQPLNYQLTERGARLVRACRTAPDYRLYALTDQQLPKPGLVRIAPESGVPIEVEVWSMALEQFGSFVAEVPPPLAIGTLVLDSGEHVKGFLCEPYAVAGREDISALGGWRAFVARSTR